jgi:hypothetical protein
VGFRAQPAFWNAVAAILWTGTPGELLRATQAVERAAEIIGGQPIGRADKTAGIVRSFDLVTSRAQFIETCRNFREINLYCRGEKRFADAGSICGTQRLQNGDIKLRHASSPGRNRSRGPNE